MALLFDANGEFVNHGSDASLDNLTTGTYLAWVYPTDITRDGKVNQKGLAGTGYRAFGQDGNLVNGRIHVRVKRAVAELLAESNAGFLTANAWHCIAGVHDTGGANGDQKLFHAALGGTITEVGAYVTQTIGAGAVGDNSGTDQIVGNASHGGAQFGGRIAVLFVWNVVLTEAELRRQQYRPGAAVVHPGNVVLHCHFGFNGTGTQRDLSGSGNDGTVTNATVDDHVRLGPFFGWDEPLLIPTAVVAGITMPILSSRGVHSVIGGSQIVR